MPVVATRTGQNESVSEDPLRLVDMGEDGSGSAQYSFPTIRCAKTAYLSVYSQQPMCITSKNSGTSPNSNTQRRTAWLFVTIATRRERCEANRIGRG